MYRFDFNSREYEMLIEKCPFTDEEKEILQMRRLGKSTIEISLKTNLCLRAVQKRIKSIYNKISRELDKI